MAGGCVSRAELIYPIQRYLKRELSRIENDGFNRDILLRYYKVRTSQVQPMSVLNELIRLNMMSKMVGKKFEDCTIQDIEDLVFTIDGLRNKDNTKNKYRKVLRAFFKWLRGCSGRDYPPEVRWITLKKVPYVTVTAEDLLPFEECVRISELADNIRDRALIQCLLDAGCRIGEILTPKISEVEFNDLGAVVQSDGKTGKAPLILTWSAKALAVWMNVHPFRDSPDAPLWTSLGSQRPSQISYAAAYQVFRKCVKKSGISKRVWPHLFKHVSSSYDSEIGLPDSYRKFKHHWTPSSRMTQVYEHLSKSVISKIQIQSMKLMNQDVDESKIQKPPEKIELHKRCRRCNFDNMRDAAYCNRCAFPLNDSDVMEMSLKRSGLETLLKKVKEDPEKLEKLLSLIS